MLQLIGLNIVLLILLLILGICFSIIAFILFKKDKVQYLIAIIALPFSISLFPAEVELLTRLSCCVVYVLSGGIFFLILFIASTLYTAFKKDKQVISQETKSANKPLSITLPINSPYEITETFIENFSTNIDQYVTLCMSIDANTKTFINTYKDSANDLEKEEQTKNYLMWLSMKVAYFVGGSTRVHFRIKSSNSYVKYVATYADGIYDRPITDMNSDNTMIEASFKNHVSLIKSQNKSLGKNTSSHTWKDFLTYAIYTLVHDGQPIFTFGISVKKNKSEMLYFAHICEFENIIENAFINIINETDFKEFVTRTYFAA